MPAPRWFRKRVQAVDAALDVEWLPRERCYAITQKFVNTPSVETLTDRIADEACRQLAKEGQVRDRTQVARAVYLQVQRNAIVFRVEDKDGTPLPLDERVLQRLEKMAWGVRNRTAKDWIAAADQEDYEAKRSRDRAIGTIWEDVRRDKIFHQCVGDIMRGLRPRYHVGGPLPPTATMTP